MKRDTARMGLAIGREYWDSARARGRRDFADQPALSYSWRPEYADHAACAADGFVQDGGDRVEFPDAPHEFGLAAAAWVVFADRQQLPGRHGVVSSFDLHRLRLAKLNAVLDE